MRWEGLIQLPWWGYLFVGLSLTHITIVAVTIFLHRSQAHRALDLHPAVSHFFRFWLWLTTSIITKEWVAIHRKHHAKCETHEDPHSPQILGVGKVLREGAELYAAEAKNNETMEKFGSGTPKDWLEDQLYTGKKHLGIVLMLIINLILFGPIGLTIWAVQMAWIPINAAGIINGVGHYWGYRNFASDDASTNILPWGIFIGGEELHNNHHAYASSAKLSNRWYEIDIGWLYIRALQRFRLAKVKRIAPQVRFDWTKTKCDMETVQAVITHRFDVMSQYGKLLKQAYKQEREQLVRAYGLSAKESDNAMIKLKNWLHLDQKQLPAQDLSQLQAMLNHANTLKTIYALKQELTAIWARSTVSQEQLLHQLESWCNRAESTGIHAMQEFTKRLRSYCMA